MTDNNTPFNIKNKTMGNIKNKTMDKILSQLSFNDKGLVAAIAQQASTGDVLMMAWMNADAVRETLATGRVCYYSRSRSALWRKGEKSGQIQKLLDFRWDCDGDTILLQVDQTGVACHTGRENCFFRALRNNDIKVIADVKISPDELYAAKD